MKKTWFGEQGDREFNFMEYLHSSHFAQDFLPVRTGEDEFEWTEMTAQRGWEIEFLNGIPLHVKSIKRRTGTADEFARFLGKAFAGVDTRDIVYFLQCLPVVDRR